jgi:hypothetical protein
MTRTRLRAVACSLFLTLVLCGKLQAAERIEGIEWFNDFEVSIEHNDNIGQSEKKRDINNDEVALVNYSFLSNIELSGNQAVTFKAFAEHEQVNNVKDMSRSTAGLKFVYRWQNSLGYTAPFYQFNTSIQLDEYNADQRDSTVSKTQLFMTKRLSDQLVLVAGVSHDRRNSEGAVFDLKNNRVFFNLDYSPRNRSVYYLSYDYRKGTTWSVAQPVFCDGTAATDIFPLIAAAEKIERDQAFNEAYCGRWSVYRLEADTQTFGAGINFAVSSGSAVDISATWVDSQAKSGLSYQSAIIRASYLLRL